jgi:hypothetical protein
LDYYIKKKKNAVMGNTLVDIALVRTVCHRVEHDVRAVAVG